MKVCVLGWYGTETLGDRAILVGIIKILAALDPNVTMTVGSLYDFYSERTLFEEREYINEIIEIDKFSFFPVSDKRLLKKQIINSDWVIMGGGPLMDMYEMELIKESFSYAQRKSKRTILFGCGIGSLTESSYKRMTSEIFMLSDCVILRDELSRQRAIELGCNKTKMNVCFDPAFLGIDRNVHNEDSDQYAVVNLRDYSYLFDDKKKVKIDQFIDTVILELCSKYESIFLVPNHTFYIGGDDRLFFEQIKSRLRLPNIEIVSKPLNLRRAYELIKGAEVCIGMRYHAILFQTVLNGKNLIIDYTEPRNGKITGFLGMISARHYYRSRYINIHDNDLRLDVNSSVDKFVVGEDIYKNITTSYIDILTAEMNR